MFNLGNAYENKLVSKQEENKYYDENITIDLNDKNNTHSIIASKIKPNSICLDVGCGAGYTGQLLMGKDCKVYGIDIDKEAIIVANKKNIYEDLYNFSITDIDNPDYNKFINSNLKFDYIIFADVLEHVVDPGKLIFEFSKKLNEHGKILVSVPNIAHMDICTNIINRTFNYNKIGILDNTHLRFFTKQSFCQMVDAINEIYNTNFSLEIIGKTIIDPPNLENYSCIYNILNEDKEFCVLQYVFELKQTKDKIAKNNNLVKVDYCQRLENELNSINNYKLKIEQLNDEIKILKQDNSDLLNSKCWKITYPLRVLSSSCSKIINRTKK